MNEGKKLDDSVLEGIAGGQVTFVKPVYDPPACPACGAMITSTAERVQCPKCLRWFRVEGDLLKEE